MQSVVETCISVSATLMFYLAVSTQQTLPPVLLELICEDAAHASETKQTCDFWLAVQAHFSAQVHQLNLSFAKDVKNHNVSCQ